MLPSYYGGQQEESSPDLFGPLGKAFGLPPGFLNSLVPQSMLQSMGHSRAAAAEDLSDQLKQLIFALQNLPTPPNQLTGQLSPAAYGNPNMPPPVVPQPPPGMPPMGGPPGMPPRGMG